MHRPATLFIAILASVSGLRVLAQMNTTLAYDNIYDNGKLSLNSVACSDGSNGLATNYPTLGLLPNFPNVGGVYTVSGWNSPQCGTCYAVTYKDTTVNIVAVDWSSDGFTVSQEAMDALTGGHAAELGRVDVSFVQVDASGCGLA